MNMIKNINNKISGRIARQAVSAVLALVFCFSAFMTGTFAWASMNQSALNEVMGNDKSYPVQLVKYEKLTDGTETTDPISGAEFYLYTSEDQQVGGRFVTDGNGKIAVKVKPGNYYFEETNPSRGFTYDTDNGNAIKQYPFTVLGNETDVVTVTAYNRPIEGSLIITKTVKNADDSVLTQAQLDTQFTFTVTFTDNGTYSYKINNGAAQSLASGGTIQLKHGDSAVFTGIPVGVIYTVVETPATDYVTTSSDHQGTITENGSTAAFTNAAQLGSLTITKTVTGKDADLTKPFEFTVTIGAGSPGGGKTETVTLKHGESKTYDDLPIGMPYTVTEKNYTAEGYIVTPSAGSYTGSVDGAVTLPFVNTYSEGSEPGSLRITKTVTGPGADLTKEFTFTVTIGDDTDTIRLKNGESKLYENIPAGTPYSVAETRDDDYRTTVNIGGSVVAANQTGGVIASGYTTDVGFTNIKTDTKTFNLTVGKTIEGNYPEEDKDLLFHFILNVEGQEPQAFTIKAGDSMNFIVPVGVAYTVTETDIPANYSLVKVENGSGTTTDAVVAEFTNTYTGPWNISVSGEKTWDKQGQTVDLPSSITVRLMNGTTVVASKSVQPDDNGKWLYTFTDIPKYDAQGQEITYTVDEVAVAGWKASYSAGSSGGSTDIKNTYITPVTDTSLTVQKTVAGTPENPSAFKFILTALNGAPMPLGSSGSVKTVIINGTGSSGFGAITYTTAGTYIYTVAELNTGESGYIYDTTVYTYTVAVAEQNGRLVVTDKALTENGNPAEKAIFTNTYDADKTSIKVVKVWQDDNDPDRPVSVQAQLYRDGSAQGSPVTLSADNNWSYIWTGLDKSAVWTVDEINVPDGYSRIVSGDAVNGFTITNAKGGAEKTSVTVTKVWNDNDDPGRPLNVQAQLYKDGNAQGSPVTLSADNGWTYTWAGLDKGPVYTINEISVPGSYAKTISGDASTGFIITNTKTVTPPDHTLITVSGKKTWDHGANPENKQPVSIVVILKADGNIVLQKQITAHEYWSWNFTVPKYADDGHEIQYTVDEAWINDYTKEINGYNITNTYNSGNPPHISDFDTPKTGDNSHMVLWIVLMAGSALGLTCMFILGKGKRKKYIPMH